MKCVMVLTPHEETFLNLGDWPLQAPLWALRQVPDSFWGETPDANVGWGRTEAGKDMFFNRKPFEVDHPPIIEIVGPVERPEWSDFLFNRYPVIGQAIQDGWNPNNGWETIEDERVREYYSRHPDRWPEMLQAFVEMDRRSQHREKHRDRFALAWAYGNAYDKGLMTANFPSGSL